ncbi:MAG TPA: AAA family ATPase [Woeseiaceae bacterium]|nr:AAA family ATPase [Woeseiaceae bacterium]
MSRIKVLICSRSEAAAQAVAAKVRDHRQFEVSVHTTTNGHADPLHDVRTRPDLLILHHVPGYGELEHMATLSPNQRIRLLVFGPAGDAEAMRLAMRAGACDYLPEPLSEADLLHGLELVCEELSRHSDRTGNLLTLLNSKGGSGASFIATNLACALGQDGSRRTTLVDLDLQFGGVARYLDLSPERGLLEALESIDDMDEVSADAYTTAHKSGVKVLAASGKRLIEQSRVASERIDMLLQLFLQNSDYVVADLPCHIDTFASTVLERSDRILLVVQQSLAHVNCAARLLQIMHDEFALRRERVEIVVNRFTKNAVIELPDIRKTLRVENLHVIPNQYKLVSDSIDTGNPVVQSAKGAAVAKALRDLTDAVGGSNLGSKRRGGFLGRALPNLLGSN